MTKTIRKLQIITITILLITLCLLFMQMNISTAEENPILNKGTIGYTGTTNYMSYNVYLTAHGINGNTITDHTYYNLYMEYASFKRILFAPAFEMNLDVVVKLNGNNVATDNISKTIYTANDMKQNITITSIFYGYGDYEVIVSGTIKATSTEYINKTITYSIIG